MTKLFSRCFLCISFVAACTDATPSDQLMAKAAELDLRGEANLSLVEVCSDDFEACGPDDDRTDAARIFECNCDSNGGNCVCCMGTKDSIGMCCDSSSCAGTP
jgi:hypothetical protein